MFVGYIELDIVLRGLLLTLIAMSWVVILVRINGLRSFSKMTNFDFVMTVAIGSLLAGASQATQWLEYFQILIAMAGMFIVQFSSAYIRKRSEKAESLMQNQPIILMRNGKVLNEALSYTRVAESDLYAKLREANVLKLADVRAVVLETTGDISVLHGSECEEKVLHGTKYC
ncbi:DUF421 domain-containing protein [Alteromonas sp. ASW11-130]|uniref:DUF421 domain-containing protein n=1 Tax=Alteromonas sp. ASW11-130 TaxID=3015775 RepID=UPI002241B558|nr:YetF domain-containing protein [Alteromonas sp. ASW11-130]MCW8092318.1 DUF421 domain-containing protein [Alteromonas sp. ASW11-130]